MTTDDRSCDRAALAALLVPAVLLPSSAHAVQVGCFFTAVFLGMMFLVCLGLTAVTKHLLARYCWKVPRTPWLRFFGLTWIELLIGIIVFATVRTGFWTTVAIYLPIAMVVNMRLLDRIRQAAPAAGSAVRRYGIFLLLPAVLPLSLQVSGLLWRTVTNSITFTELH